MKRVIRPWILALAASIPIALAALYLIGVFLGMAGGENWTIGYYGKFNRVKNLIQALPDVEIVDTWQHHDVTMEDFSFTIRTASGSERQIEFSENSPQMAMTSTPAIQSYIQKQLE